MQSRGAPLHLPRIKRIGVRRLLQNSRMRPFRWRILLIIAFDIRNDTACQSAQHSKTATKSDDPHLPLDRPRHLRVAHSRLEHVVRNIFGMLTARIEMLRWQSHQPRTLQQLRVADRLRRRGHCGKAQRVADNGERRRKRSNDTQMCASRYEHSTFPPVCFCCRRH